MPSDTLGLGSRTGPLPKPARCDQQCYDHNPQQMAETYLAPRFGWQIVDASG